MKLCSRFAFATTALLLLSRRNGILVANAQENQQFGGQLIDPNEFRWFTAIRRLDNNGFMCSGALVGSRHVVTARHCVENFPSNSIIVEVGYMCRNRSNCLRENSFVGVSRKYQHEDGGDMALLTLDHAVSIDVQPAVPYLGASVHPRQSYLKNKKKGRRMQLVGAGRTGADSFDPISFSVTKLEVRYLSPEDCRSRVSTPSLITDFVVCSIPENGNPCEGDSGSALVVPGKQQFEGRDVVMAVHNFGPKECDAAPDQAIGHFRLEDAADLLQEVVCEGEFQPEDWCPIRRVVGTKLHTLDGHTGGLGIGGLSFNPDGSRLLSSGLDGSNKLWNPLRGGAALATFPVDAPFVYDGRFHPLEIYFASGSFDGTVNLWKTDTTGEPFHVFEGHDQRVHSVSWSPCGTKLASASFDGTIKVWSIVTRELVTTITGHSTAVTSVAFHPDGTQLASASADSTVKQWDATTDSFDLIQTLSDHTDIVWTVSYSPNGQFLAAGSNDNVAKVWDVTTGELLHTFRGHGSNIAVLVWSPDGRLVATGSADSSVRIWDARNGGPSLLTLNHDNHVHGLDWSSDGTLLASGMFDSSDIFIWRISIE